MKPLRSRRDDEQGAVAVIVAICLVLLFTVTAMAIDLGFARADVRQNQSISDFASLAGASALVTGYEDACRSAVNYVYANAEELTAPAPAAVSSGCTAFETLDASGCDDTTPPVETTLSDPASPYTILIASPVEDTDPTMTVEGQAVDTSVDGDRCQRIKVVVSRQRDYIFGTVMGFLSGQPTADAVALQREIGDPDEYASLIVLERTACNALDARGGGDIHVLNATTSSGDLLPGSIAVDSDGLGGSGSDKCSSTKHTVALSGSGARIYAEGMIQLYALSTGGSSHPTGYPTTALGESIEPRSRRMTRAPADWAVNCKATYPGSHQRYPGHFAGDTWDFGPCPDAGEPDNVAYVDELYANLQGAGVPAGFQTVTTCGVSPLVIDGLAPTVDPQQYVPAGCRPATMVFRNVDHVVFEEHVDQRRLIVEGPATGGTVVYFRNAGMRHTNAGADPCDPTSSDAGICLKNAFVYVDSPGTAASETHDPSISFNNPGVVWEGPTISGSAGKCSPSDPLPRAACFAPMALWSNSSRKHSFAGTGVANLAGTFFTPNAQMDLSGGSGFDFLDAQFLSRVIRATGGGTIQLKPNPDTNLPDPRYGVGLIR